MLLRTLRSLPKNTCYQGGDKLDVGIKFILNQAGNVLINQHGDINRTQKILEDDSLCEMVVVIDNHMTPSAKFADILLPETSYLEAGGLVDNDYAPGSYNFMVSMEPVVKPMWEVRSTYDICADNDTFIEIQRYKKSTTNDTRVAL
ncbi:MAG: molybdopterin-dependent oxidoreductase [Endozoicomonas sp.]